MANFSVSMMNTTTQDKFIPELWSNEVVVAYKANLVLANLVTTMNHNGKKGIQFIFLLLPVVLQVLKQLGNRLL